MGKEIEKNDQMNIYIREDIDEDNSNQQQESELTDKIFNSNSETE